MILVKTPLRVSFVGGGTDFEKFYRLHGGRVISTTVDKYIYIAINKKFDDGVRVSYSQTENVNHTNEVQHTRVRAVLQKVGIERGVEIVTVADLPSKGIGLASSATLTVGLLNGLGKFTKEELANEACKIEIDTLGEPMGKQDQYAAAYGGLNLIEFNKDGSIKVEPIDISEKIKEKFENHLLFFYTNKTRSASPILQYEKDNMDLNTETLIKMSDIVPKFYEALTSGDFKYTGELLHESWKLKKNLSSDITDPEIDKMYKLGRDNGAWGGKIVGAGGGGFLMFIAPPHKHNVIRKAISWREVNMKFTNEGSKVIHV